MFAFATRALSDSLGTEIIGVDLARLDDTTFETIRATWQREPLVLFRRQSLTEAELVAFSRRFGTLDVDVFKDVRLDDPAAVERNPDLFFVSNLHYADGTQVGALANDELVWHTDLVYRGRPATGSIFYGVEMPVGAARTSYCNLARAYRTLPGSLRARVEGKRLRCKYANRQPLASFMREHLDKTFRREAGSEEEARAIEQRNPEVAHDMVLENPTTGERTLYFSPNHAVGIENMAEADARVLFDSVIDHALADENVYTHEWRNGDVMLWDNARLLHRREAFDGRVPRLAKRTTVFLDPAYFTVPSTTARAHESASAS